MRNIFTPDPDTMTEMLMLLSPEDLRSYLVGVHRFFNPQTQDEDRTLR